MPLYSPRESIEVAVHVSHVAVGVGLSAEVVALIFHRGVRAHELSMRTRDGSVTIVVAADSSDRRHAPSAAATSRLRARGLEPDA